MTVVRSLLTRICLALIVAGPAAAQTWVTERDIEARSGGYPFQLEDGTRAAILEVRPPRGTEKECRVHLPSVRELASKEAQGKPAGIAIPVPLGFEGYDPDSAVLPGCRGPGTDCIVWIAVMS